MFAWYRHVSATERRTFWTCFAGWALDALDLQMFSLVIPALVASWGVSKGEAGMVAGVTLITSACGGWLGGAMADRWGRVRALQVTVAWFSAATFLSAFAMNFEQLLVLKGLQGFGFGGEWTVGAVLMGEMIRPEHRGKALGSVQSAWAIGWGAAVLLNAAAFSLFPPELAWRALFGIGLLPALLILYARRAIPEPPVYAAAAPRERLSFQATVVGILSPAVLRTTLIGGLLGIGAHGGYHAVTTWLPTYLKTERHLSVLGTGGYLAVIILGFFCGCMASAALLDVIGRRRNIAFFAIGCVVIVIAYVFLPVGNTAMLFLGFPLGFFSAGIPASMGALFNELYPNGIRGTGVGFCYNFGRIVAAGFPVAVGMMSASMPLGWAIGIDAALAYSLVLVAIAMLPETKGKHLGEAVAA